jgi:hypothetical protein
MSQETMPPLNALVELGSMRERMKDIPEIKQDVKAILVSMQQVELRLAACPTFEDCRRRHEKELAPVVADVAKLKQDEQRVIGGWRVVAFIISICGLLSAAVSWLVSRPHPNP